MTKMNKEMKMEVKQLKSQIKSLKREVMDAKEGSSKQEDSVNTLKLTPQEIDELLAVRESVHSAFERSLKSTTDAPDRGSNVEDPSKPLDLWLSTSSTSPSAKSDDAIQLPRTVILYVKVLTTHQDTCGGNGNLLMTSFHYIGEYLGRTS